MAWNRVNSWLRRPSLRFLSRPLRRSPAFLDVYVEDRKRFLGSSYILKAVLGRMARRDVSFRLLDRLDPARDAAAAFVHVDLTTVPAPFTWVSSFYPRCLNGRSGSIARDLYSMARLLPGDDFSGPAIVKTTLNARGLPELKHAATERRLGRLDDGLRDRICPKYRIFPTIKDIPDAVWADSGLIVERFVPGTLNLPVVKYRYEFMLDVELNTRGEFGNLLCDPDSLIRLDFIEGVPISGSSGGYWNGVEWIAKAVEQHSHSYVSPFPKTFQGSALLDRVGEYDVIVTDPPYYDAIPYSDLSDFFFVWFKRALPNQPLLRDPFDPENPLTPKKFEIVHPSILGAQPGRACQFQPYDFLMEGVASVRVTGDLCRKSSNCVRSGEPDPTKGSIPLPIRLRHQSDDQRASTKGHRSRCEPFSRSVHRADEAAWTGRGVAHGCCCDLARA